MVENQHGDVRFLETPEIFRKAKFIKSCPNYLDAPKGNFPEVLICGKSNVGKSSLINAISPEIAVKTGEISNIHDKGMHTTTFSEMFEIFPNTYLIDTPGVKGFGTIDFKKEEVSHFFPEIFRASVDCRFGNCMHLKEPGCAVKKALEEHYISESRYNSYLSILEDCDEGKYR